MGLSCNVCGGDHRSSRRRAFRPTGSVAGAIVRGVLPNRGRRSCQCQEAWLQLVSCGGRRAQARRPRCPYLATLILMPNCSATTGTAITSSWVNMLTRKALFWAGGDSRPLGSAQSLPDNRWVSTWCVFDAFVPGAKFVLRSAAPPVAQADIARQISRGRYRGADTTAPRVRCTARDR